jgi:hypothetical protein
MQILECGIVLMRRIHRIAIRFVVPPCVTVVGRLHIRARMYMTRHALTRRNLLGEDMLKRVSALRLIDCAVIADAAPVIPMRRGLFAVSRIAVIGIQNMTGRAATGAVISGLVVGTGKRKHGIHEPRFLQTEEDRVGSKTGAEAAIGELEIGLTGHVLSVWIANLTALLAATLKDAEQVARLGILPPLQRVKVWKDSLTTRLLGCRRWECAQTFRLTLLIVGLPEVRILERKRSIVI